MIMGGEAAEECLRRGRCRHRAVADDAQVDGPVPAQGMGLDVDLCHACVRPDQPAVSHGPHVQGAAEADDHIGVGHERRGQR